MKGEGQEMHQRDLGFFSKQGRKILRHIFGSSIEEDARKGVKMRVYQGICSLQTSLLLPFLLYCPDSPQKQKERLKLNTSASDRLACHRTALESRYIQGNTPRGTRSYPK